jgi:hypothetical protein
MRAFPPPSSVFTNSLNSELGVATRIVNSLVFISAILIGTISAPAIATPKASTNYQKRILGQWLGPRKIEVYHRDGTWGVRRNEEAQEDKNQRRWSIKGNKLTITFPGDHGTDSAIFTIISLTSQELILESDGYRRRYERFVDKGE